MSFNDISYKLGIKLFSTNTQLVDEAVQLVRDGVFSYIELYTPYESFNSTKDAYQFLDIPFVIHAPHFGNGVNLSDSKLRDSNRRRLEDTFQFADMLDASHIIVHGGFGGSMDELISQCTELNDSRLVLENIPRIGINNEDCIGYSYEQLHQAVNSEAFSGMVLDIGHAVCAANAQNISWRHLITQFLSLSPVIFHLSDGYTDGLKDIHLSLDKEIFHAVTF